jgi:hypothetical protein
MNNPPQKRFLPKKNVVSAPTKQHKNRSTNTKFNMNLPAQLIYLPEETVSPQAFLAE